jgi:hypothetical protein
MVASREVQILRRSHATCLNGSRPHGKAAVLVAGMQKRLANAGYVPLNRSLRQDSFVEAR